MYIHNFMSANFIAKEKKPKDLTLVMCVKF